MALVLTTSRKQKMQNKAKLKNKVSHINLCAILFCVFIALFSTSVSAQDDAQANTTKPELKLKDINSQSDIDAYIGKVVRIDGEYVIVAVSSPSKIKDRVPMYYACDSKMTPTAILENINIAHRSCATFKTKSGTTLVGDTVMVKYFAPEIKD